MVTTDVAKSRVGWMAAGAMLMVLARQGWVVGGGGRCEPHDQALGSVAADRHGAGVRGAGARDVAWPDRAPAAVETTVMPLVTQLQPLARKGADRMVRARDVTQVTNAPTTTLAVKPKPAPIAPARETDPTQACHRPPWIVWMGDSNMRHTYYWWTTNQLQGVRKESAQFGLDRSDLEYGGRWSDQEAYVEAPGGRQHVRSSFRFLHGSWHEFAHDTTHWHDARQGKQGFNDGRWNLNETKPTVKPGGGDGGVGGDGARADTRNFSKTIRPNSFALFVTRHQLKIEHPAPFAAVIAPYAHAVPDVVVLTEGWTGIPKCENINETLAVFAAQPETIFVWAPLYVTNHQVSRHDCFAEHMPKVLPSNVRVVDLWSHTRTLDQNARGLVHIPIGGTFMKECVRLLEAAMCGGVHPE
eukprot:m.132148 g.132148  ORF g.132148 m.132148 type:complete len:413 (-) comp22434_c0_seq1:235-1473(-)